MAGSVAYGLATADSDVDTVGIYVTPTCELAGLRPGPESVVATDPDIHFHEIGKFCRLALKGAPGCLEWLYLDVYDHLSPDGADLLAARDAFLSKRIYHAYRGFSINQFKGADKYEGARREKALRYGFRCLEQGRKALETGRIPVKVDDPEQLRRLSRLPDDETLTEYGHKMVELEIAWKDSSLPEHPDEDRVADLLLDIRRRHAS